MISVMVMRIVMMLMFVIVKVRLGSEEEYRDWEAREEEGHWTRCWDQYRGCWTPADLREGEASD